MSNIKNNKKETLMKKPKIYNQYNNEKTTTEQGSETYETYQRITEGGIPNIIIKETRNRYNEIQEAAEGTTVLEMLKKYEAEGIVTPDNIKLKRKEAIENANYGTEYLPKNPIEALNMINKANMTIEQLNEYYKYVQETNARSKAVQKNEELKKEIMDNEKEKNKKDQVKENEQK